MAPYAGFFWLEVVGDTVGLIIGYRAALFPSLRRQILYLLTPIGLLVLDGILNWAVILSRDTGRIPPELINLLLILAGFLYADAVLRYGSFAGRPVARRDLFYSLLAAAVGLAALYLTVDRWLATYTPFPYPLATGILVVIVAVGFPAASRWLTAWLDKVLFRAEGQQRAIEAAQCALVTGYLARGRRRPGPPTGRPLAGGAGGAGRRTVAGDRGLVAEGGVRRKTLRSGLSVAVDD